MDSHPVSPSPHSPVGKGSTSGFQVATIGWLFAVSLLAVVGTVLWLGDPSSSLERRQKELFRAIERTEWSQVRQLLAPDYSDTWGFNRTTLVPPGLPQSRQKPLFQILTFEENWEWLGREARYTTLLRVKELSQPLPSSVRQEVNLSFHPTAFLWRQQSWKPWDWKLVAVENPELDLPRVHPALRP